jgi:ABC-type branched-subunit amino acid transport system substrate-binding protein
VAAALGVLAACSSAPPPGVPAGVQQLLIGTLVPMTGELAHLGPAESAGIALAVKVVNAAGGVLGQPIATVDGDSGDAYSSVASQTVDRELGLKVAAIVGATGSSVTMEVIDKVVGSGVVLVSPGDTNDKLSTYPAQGLYFRMVPPDTLQSSVLTALLEHGPRRSVAIMHIRDVYGAGLAADLAADIVKAGGKVVVSVEYDGQATDFSAAVSQVAVSAPDAIVLVGAGESKTIIAELVKAGVGPASVPLYLTDLDLSNVLAAGLRPGTMDGVEGTRPGVAPSASFLAALALQSPDLKDVGYAAQSYDAVVMIALAADAAASTKAKAIAAQLPEVGNGPTRCTSYQACVALIKDGRNIAYVGASGPITIGTNGTPTAGTIGVYRFGATNTYPSTGIDYVTGTVPLSAP